MKNILVQSVLLMSGLFFIGCSSPEGVTYNEKRNNIMMMASQSLVELYEAKPTAQEKMQKTVGYGVFSNVNLNVIFVSAGNGYGVVVDNETGKKTYMKMAMGGVGLGVGAKDFRAVILFYDKETMTRFVEQGWEFGAHADAAAKSGEKGGAAGVAGNVSSGMEIYQFTNNGVALQATLAGTKYWQDHELNFY